MLDPGSHRVQPTHSPQPREKRWQLTALEQVAEHDLGIRSKLARAGLVGPDLELGQPGQTFE